MTHPNLEKIAEEVYSRLTNLLYNKQNDINVILHALLQVREQDAKVAWHKTRDITGYTHKADEVAKAIRQLAQDNGKE